MVEHKLKKYGLIEIQELVAEEPKQRTRFHN